MKKYLLLSTLFISINSFGQMTRTVYKTIAGKKVYDVTGKNIYVVTTGFMIDADGSPKAYHNNDKKALDHLSNAGSPGNWWALVTDNGKPDGAPLIQDETAPARGYYISMTTLEDQSKNTTDPNRYVNSETILYIAMPAGFASDFKPGDVALVINKNNNKRCYAIFADVGPRNKIGEGSIYLAKQLGIESSPKDGGISSGVVFILFKQSGSKKILNIETINSIGKSKLTEGEITELLH